jgi:hypothetical protein
MTPRERVRAVLRGDRPDRVPNGLGATLNTGMHLLAYERFRTLLGLGGPPPRMMSFEANALFDLPVMTAIGADMVSLGLKITPARFWALGSMADWKQSALWGREYLREADTSIPSASRKRRGTRTPRWKSTIRPLASRPHGSRASRNPRAGCTRTRISASCATR